MKQYRNDNGWWLSDWVVKNKNKPLKILLCFICIIAFAWFFLDFPNFRISHLIIAITVVGGIFWVYLVRAKK